ncbi:very-short-patch-repair endonuclease [Caulobacter ginsengisoli]|uniref:Very-short-patch-repair endonuclease n=2 Tax=Caulobacter ginsengisoli TaxID=400775 RepID=A0ABU0IWY8_9CAUL|nr:very-short-patch-repair endonuclease [Caulobacter ginsengisoli]
MTYSEVVLWTLLRRGGLQGLHFRKQHPFGRFVLDFYCDEIRLAVEVDGGIHHLEARRAEDAQRDAWLADRHIRVLRIPSGLVVHDPNRVKSLILAAGAEPFERPWGRTASAQ